MTLETVWDGGQWRGEIRLDPARPMRRVPRKPRTRVALATVAQLLRQRWWTRPQLAAALGCAESYTWVLIQKIAEQQVVFSQNCATGKAREYRIFLPATDVRTING